MTAPVTRYRVVPFVAGDVVNEDGVALPPYTVLAGTAKWLLRALRHASFGPVDTLWTAADLATIAARVAGTTARTIERALMRLHAGGYLVAVDDEEVV